MDGRDSNAEIRTSKYRRWRAARLREIVLCEACRRHRLDVPATELDHVVRRSELRGRKLGLRAMRYGRGAMKGLMHKGNVAGLCTYHHRLRSRQEGRRGVPLRFDTETGRGVSWWMYREGEEYDLGVKIPNSYKRLGY